MSEIRFRGQTGTTEGKKWVYGYYYKVKNFFNDKERHFIGAIRSNHLTDFSIDENTIGQYTRLHDKNGKEIYEGDIVSFNLKSDNEGQPNIIGYIEYQTTFSGYRIMSFKGSFALDYNIKDIEVIGNIYDNSNFLEEGE